MNAEPPRELHSDVPRAPDFSIEARVVLVHGSSVHCAGQSPVCQLTRQRDRILPVIPAKAGIQATCVSYALVMEISNPVQVGDKLVTPN